MRWEERLVALFDDLEQQAEGLALSERDLEVAERSRAEYAQVDLASRLHASAGTQVVLRILGAGQLDATLRRLGVDWCLAESGSQEWLVRFAAITSLRGLSSRALGEQARSVAARLGFGSALRGIADERAAVVLHRVDGSPIRGRVRRVGADFLEISAESSFANGADDEDPKVEIVPFVHIAAIRQT
jgi:hypothetical protein